MKIQIDFDYNPNCLTFYWDMYSIYYSKKTEWKDKDTLCIEFGRRIFSGEKEYMNCLQPFPKDEIEFV